MFGDPDKEPSPGFPPAQIFRRATQPVVPRNHAASRRLRHPHGGFFRGFRRVTPQRMAVSVRAGYIGDGAALHDALRDSPLLRAIPDRRAAATALVIGIEPPRNA